MFVWKDENKRKEDRDVLIFKIAVEKIGLLFIPSFGLNSSSFSLNIALYLEWTGKARAYPVIADQDPTYEQKAF